MSILRITGGRELSGEAFVHGAKNSVLPIMAASIISSGETVIHNCPDLSDVDAALKILRHLGCTAEKRDNTVYIDSRTVTRCDIPDKLMREMRSSVIFLGAILARKGEARLSLPGGCELGPRPIDMHISALRAMGAEISEYDGNIICRAPELRGCRIDLALPSVGATENSILAAAGCEGETLITNAAREPEITDLCGYLGKLGVSVSGAGTSKIYISGADFRPYTEHTAIPDRIVAATYLASAVSARSAIDIINVIPEHLKAVTETFSAMGCRIKNGKDYISIDARGKLTAPEPVITRPYPGFPTDAQPPLMAASLMADGVTIFVETIFKDRFRHVGELLRMGADIRTDGQIATVTCVKRLHAAPVAATDLRGGAALAVAALAAEGTTEISGLWHMDRGYDGLEKALKILGADIERI